MAVGFPKHRNPQLDSLITPQIAKQSISNVQKVIIILYAKLLAEQLPGLSSFLTIPYYLFCHGDIMEDLARVFYFFIFYFLFFFDKSERFCFLWAT